MWGVRPRMATKRFAGRCCYNFPSISLIHRRSQSSRGTEQNVSVISVAAIVSKSPF